MSIASVNGHLSWCGAVHRRWT